MKAVVVSGPGRVSLEDRPEPVPGESDVVVQIAYANICHTDHFIIEGGHPAVRYPVVPGHEMSGLIVAVGSKVPESRLGQRVTIQTQLGCRRCASCHSGAYGRCSEHRELGSSIDGGWQELLTVPEWAAVTLPESVSLLAGSLTEPSANAHAAVARALIQPGDNVVVIGPGPIGLLTVEHAKLSNPNCLVLVGLPGDEIRLKLGLELGASAAVTLHDRKDVLSVRRAIGDEGANAVIQCAGSVDATALGLEVAAEQGRVVLEGYSGTYAPIEFRPDDVAVRSLSILGVRGWVEADFLRALELTASHLVDCERVVSDAFPLTDFALAIQRSLDYSGGAVKVTFSNSVMANS